MFIKHEPIKIDLPIFELADIFRESAAVVFAHLGKDEAQTTIETFTDLGRIRPDSTGMGFFSFRNENLFYWVLIKTTHRKNSPENETLRLEFESQVKDGQSPIFLAYTENFSSGVDLLGNSIQNLKQITFEFEENLSLAGQKIVASFLPKLAPDHNIFKTNVFEPEISVFEMVTEKLAFPPVLSANQIDNTDF